MQRLVDLVGAAAVRLPSGGDKGAEHAFHLRTSPMRDDDGHLLGAVTVMEDITQMRAHDQARVDFIDVAVEHLRLPLTEVELGLHSVLEGSFGDLSEKQSDVLQSCRADCERLDELLRDLLELSHLEAGAQPAHASRIDPAYLLKGAGEKIRTQIESKRITLIVSAPANLPMVWADRDQIDRMLAQLTDNAIRHTPAGGEIELVARLNDSEIRIEVSNTGEVIPREFEREIFEKFIQVPNAPAGRSGLGLAIGKRLIEQNGGQVSVRSEPGRGVIFSFTLPLAS
ncbi:MAG: HAMP domain-containing sensor histidine kinase [Pyrinomonadaceae bacterium]